MRKREAAVEKEEPSNDGLSMQVRDKGNTGKRLADFCALPAALDAMLKEWHVACLRIYTSFLFKFLINPFRDRANRDGFQQTHPLPATMLCIDEGLRMMRSARATHLEAATEARRKMLAPKPKNSSDKKPAKVGGHADEADEPDK